MNKLILNEEQNKVFTQALRDMYKLGNQDGTFTMQSMHELVEGEQKSIDKMLEKYVEKT